MPCFDVAGIGGDSGHGGLLRAVWRAQEILSAGGVTGGAAWLIYSGLLHYAGCTATEATLLATLGAVFLSRIFAVAKQCPVTIFLVAGLIPLAPGAGIYWTAYYLVTDQLALARSSGFAALKAAFAIVLGIVAMFELPGGLFRTLAGRRKE